MKRYNLLYYLLMVLLILGAFAAMAQNSYGQTILGLVAIAFGLTFLIRFIDEWSKKSNRDAWLLAECSTLFLLALIFAAEIFQYNFAFLDSIFLGAGIVLALVYVRKAVNSFRQLQSVSKLMSIRISAFYLSIVLFIVAMMMTKIDVRVADIVRIAAISLLFFFLLSGLTRQEISEQGEPLSALKWITKPKDCAVLLVAMFFIFALYVGFTRNGVLPKLYSDEYPQAYFELVNKAESGKDMRVNDQYRYESFIQQYDQFVKRNIGSAPKQ